MGILIRTGAAAYDALAGITTATYKAMNKPGTQMVRSKNPFTRAIGAAWLAMFGVILPFFALKCLAGLALTGDPLYAWRH